MAVCFHCGKEMPENRNDHNCLGPRPATGVAESTAQGWENAGDWWRQTGHQDLTVELLEQALDLWKTSFKPSDQRIWTSILEGSLCGTVVIRRDDLPRDRQEMRQFLHTRLQAFGDALMAEWEKQVWDDPSIPTAGRYEHRSGRPNSIFGKVEETS